MSEMSPTYRTIFSEEYWGELHGLSDKVAATPNLDVYRQMRLLTASAAEAIFHGSERTRLPAGTRIDPRDENPELTPGTVTLLDYETLSIGGVNVRGEDVVQDYERPFHKQRYISDEGYLMAQPSTLFMRNSRRWPLETEVTVFPYSKAVPDTEQNAEYSRSIRFAAYGIGTGGDTIIKMIPLWQPLEGGSVRGLCGLGEALSGTRFQPLEVGQSFINEANNRIIRLRSAEICLQGTIEYAKARKKVKRGVLAGRLALSKCAA
jgi:hypothetical protein